MGCVKPRAGRAACGVSSYPQATSPGNGKADGSVTEAAQNPGAGVAIDPAYFSPERAWRSRLRTGIGT